MDAEALAVAKKHYEALPGKIEQARKLMGRPLTLSEKILLSHMANIEEQPVRGQTMGEFNPDRVALQDATAQMALLQFMHTGRTKVAVPTTTHCDHLIRAHVGAATDLETANTENAEVYNFLRTSSSKYGIGFWKPGAGIIHQVVLENYAFPGGMMIGTDSHTPNAGGLGMVAIGVGGADAVDVMAGIPWGLRYPKLIGIKLTGSLQGWTASKDVILKVAGILTVKGGTGAIVEYFGPGASSISCTGKATITNMGAEIGATCSLFPFDDRMADYLNATDRPELAGLAEAVGEHLRADYEVEEEPEKFFDQVIEINLDELVPHLVGPHTPDLARPLTDIPAAVKENDYPDQLKAALIGSCTNSSYEDIGRAARIADVASAAGLKARVPFLITPGSEQVFETVKRDGYLESLQKIGGVVMANACGPCIGQWKRDDISKGDRNSIVTSFNRNFPGRNDANRATLSFIGSPETVTALALAGRLSFNPSTDTLTAEDGSEVRLVAPVAPDLPSAGFASRVEGFIAPTGTDVEIEVKPDSERIQLLERFSAWDGKDIEKVPLLLKAKGKCTTDHISPAGPWLRYRGHLENISKNMFTGAVNAFTDAVGQGLNLESLETGEFNDVARDYRSRGLGWVVVGDSNYGEGSSREHAAMEPRLLGARAVVVRSFARIHETNLKKQGVLALVFRNEADYDKVQERDRASVIGLDELAPGKDLTMIFHHEDGSEDSIQVSHTMTATQIEWFAAGSALNWIAAQAN